MHARLPSRAAARSMRLVRILLLGALAHGALTIPAAGETPLQFLRRPDLHGDQVVFTSEGDLWLGSISRRTAMRITSGEGVEGSAHFSPNGRLIAFTAQYDGGTDVYVMDVSGGMPRRLTWDPNGAGVLGWTPDGQGVMFRSSRENSTWRNRIWVVPAQGGSARLLPVPYAEFASLEQGGKLLAYVPVSAEWNNWKRYRGGEADDIWLADLSDHSFRNLTNDPSIDTEPVWVGEAIYFVSDRDGHANLHRLDPESRVVAQVTTYTDYDVRYPGSDGTRVVFEHGNGLALFDPRTGRTEELHFDLHSDRIHARERRVPASANLFSVAFGPTGKRLLVSARGQILSAPVEQGDVRAVAAEAGSRCQYPAWSPDGKQIAFVSDQPGEEQVFIAPAAGGPARQLTKDHRGPLGPLIWSPDGKWIATSDREMRVLLVNAASGAITQVDQSDRGGSYDLVNDSYRFSPDGKWLAFTRLEPNWNWSVHLYDIAGRKAFRISNPEMNSTAPAFDPDGKYLYFLSDRAFDPRYVNANRYFSFSKYTKISLVTLSAKEKSPFLTANDQEGVGTESDADETDDQTRKAGTGKDGKPAGAVALPKVRLDTEGLSDRIVDVPVPADRYVRVEPLEGRLLLESLRDTREGEDRPFRADRQLHAFDIKKRKMKVLADSLTGFQVSADRRKLLVQVEKAFSVIDADADEFPGSEEKRLTVKTDAWTLTIDPAAEWRQMFYETWRIARDFFYDPGMHGVDWTAVRGKYESLLPAMADRSDLNFILGQLVAELNCGHAYIGGGDLPGAQRVPMGFLGADLEPVSGGTPAYRVKKIYPGDAFDLDARSPLLTPGIDVKPGDFILAVAGKPVQPSQDFQSLLVGTAGHEISLTVNSRPAWKGAREVLVKPMASEFEARYFDWVASRRAYVREHGGPDLAYLHLPNMSEAGLAEFAKHYYANLGKDGMIVDVRYNSGGYIDAMILLQMSCKPYTYFKPRYGASWSRQDWGFAGHSVALCNDQSYSDAEEFCDAFQRLKLGPVIGVRTWGGEVGSGNGYRLIDGGVIYIPNYGEWTPDGEWTIEGTGVTPDIVVEDDPAALLEGRDPQLDKAIEYLTRKLAAEPIARPTPPPFPNKAGRGSDLGG